MRINVLVPYLDNPALKSPQMGRWLKGIGDVVRIGEPLFEVETEKIVFEAPGTADGILIEIHTSEGEPLLHNQVVGIIEQPDSRR
jgi:pyruvate dehydrogenase E2 component (dihydrolipoamide acetyltransferase)